MTIRKWTSNYIHHVYIIYSDERPSEIDIQEKIDNKDSMTWFMVWIYKDATGEIDWIVRTL